MSASENRDLQIADRLDGIRHRVALVSLAVQMLTVHAKGANRDELNGMSTCLIDCVEEPRAIGDEVQPKSKGP